jgi:hypothetical protein
VVRRDNTGVTATESAGVNGAGLPERLDKALARLYAHLPKSPARLMRNADIDPSQVDATGDPRAAWFAVTEAAAIQNRLSELIDAALRDHGSDEELLALKEELQDALPLTERIANRIVDLQTTYDVLRQPRHATRSELASLEKALVGLQRLLDTAEATSGTTEETSGLFGSPGAAITESVNALQLYAELLVTAPDRLPRANPFAPDTVRPLRQIADDRLTLIEAKQRLAFALASVLTWGSLGSG